MMNKAELFNTIRKQAQKVFPVLGQFNKTEKKPEVYAVGQVVEGQAKERQMWDTDYQDLQQLFRHQFPSVTKQLLGRRYNTVNNISRFVLPNGMDQASDELLELLADFASGWASTDSVLMATGCKQINQLSTDAARSQRAGFALKEVNKAIAAAQGAVSGMTGLLGAAIDLPASVIFSLKTIYEIGHSYGFELNTVDDQKAVYFALSQMDLGLIAEKQALFLVLRGLKNTLSSGDLSQVQGFLNSNYSVEQFNQYLLNEDGQYKWAALNLLNKIKVLRFATPLVGGAVGAVYNVKLIDEVATKADAFFAHARHYFNSHADTNLSVLEAYQQQQVLLAQAVPLLSSEVIEDVADVHTLQAQAADAITANETIVNVAVKAKADVSAEKLPVEETIQHGIEQLAQTYVVDVAQTDVVEVNKDQGVAKVESAEDLSKDLVQLVKQHTAKKGGGSKADAGVSAAPILEEQAEAEVLETIEKKVAPVKKPSSTAARKPVTKRTRKKVVKTDDEGSSEN